MNPTHLHLILAHIPVLLVPTGLVFVLWGLKARNRSFIQGGAALFLFAGLVVYPVFALGERSEDHVEKLAGVSERTIEAHEDAAGVSLWSTAILGLLAGAYLMLLKREKPAPRIVPALVILATVTSGSLAYTANRGGAIRHPEAYTESTSFGADYNGADDGGSDD